VSQARRLPGRRRAARHDIDDPPPAAPPQTAAAVRLAGLPVGEVYDDPPNEAGSPAQRRPAEHAAAQGVVCGQHRRFLRAADGAFDDLAGDPWRSGGVPMLACTAEEIARDLSTGTAWTAAQKKLVARLSAGAVGRARNFDLNTYLTARKDALLLLTTALGENDHAALFRSTETYRAGAEGKGKTDLLIAVLYSLLQDLLALQAGATELIRNQDLQKELAAIAAQVPFDWIVRAADGLGEVQNGMRRNLLRSLSLDGYSSSLEI